MHMYIIMGVIPSQCSIAMFVYWKVIYNPMVGMGKATRTSSAFLGINDPASGGQKSARNAGGN